ITAVNAGYVDLAPRAGPLTDPVPPGWLSLGCYTDSSARTLSTRILATVGDSAALTVATCTTACGASAYSYAGVERGGECYCGSGIFNGGAPATSGCTMACNGNATEFCGGSWRLNLYQTNITSERCSGPNLTSNGLLPTLQKTGLPGQWRYVGCLQDNVGGVRSLPYQLIFPNTNNATTCLSRCSAYGYGAGGMEWGHECYCGDASDIPAAARFVPECLCDMACSGDPSSLCGAGNKFSYYEWTGTPLQQWSYPTGSDAGLYKFLIGGVVIPLITTVGINGKITFQAKFDNPLGAPNTTGAYEFDPFYDDNFNLAWREMHVKTDIFCSAGLVLPDKVGRQLTVGGWADVSTYGIRLYWPDGSPGVNGTNDWQENPSELQLQNGRWYPSAMIMANGSILVVGGESSRNGPPVPTLEILPKVGPTIYMDWLQRTDPNNLYPFLIVLPSGGIFVGYYNEARILDEVTFDTIRTLPPVPGAVNNDTGGRTYPLEGTLVTLPQYLPYKDPLTLLACGGSTPFVGNALDNCVSIQPEVPNAQWTIERMPSKRVMTCMAPLPDGTFLILNGAHQGVAGFALATDPNLNVVLYDPSKPVNRRMSVMANTTIARMYHSEALLMADGRVLVTGSDPEDPNYPQEYRVEVFLPPYLLSGLPRPAYTIQQKDWAYGGTYQIHVTTGNIKNLRVSLLGVVSNTHGNSFGARTFFPAFSCCYENVCSITAPPNSHVSPPGWFMLFILDGPTPSNASFVRIGGDPGLLGNWPQLHDFKIPGV
ncbi:hypothetical protein Egran_04670, partial [Elaphomyces granulatus]